MGKSIMAEKTLNFNKLSYCVINQRKRQNYMDPTLMVYRWIYNGIYSLMKKLDIDIYIPEIERQFLNSVNVCRLTFSAYTCTVRRLDDYIDDIPYRCHHESPLEKVSEIFSNILNEYLNECSNTGNKSPTLLAKEKERCSLIIHRYHLITTWPNRRFGQVVLKRKIGSCLIHSMEIRPAPYSKHPKQMT